MAWFCKHAIDESSENNSIDNNIFLYYLDPDMKSE